MLFKPSFPVPAHRLAVINDETEMALVVRPLGFAKAQLNELVAHIDEGVVVAFAAQLEVKNRTIKFQRLVQIAYFEDHMVDSQRAGFFH